MQIDYQAVSDELGYKSKAVSTAAWSTLKKKLMQSAPEASNTSVAPGGEVKITKSTATKRKAAGEPKQPGPKRGRKPKSQPAPTEEEQEEDGVSDAGKLQPEPKVIDSVDGEGEVQDEAEDETQD